MQYLLEINVDAVQGNSHLQLLNIWLKRPITMLEQKHSVPEASDGLVWHESVFYSMCNSASSYSANDPLKMTHANVHLETHTILERDLIYEAISNSADNRIRPLAGIGARMNYLKGHLEGAHICHYNLTKCNAAKMNACALPSLSEGQEDSWHAYT